MSNIRTGIMVIAFSAVTLALGLSPILAERPDQSADPAQPTEASHPLQTEAEKYWSLARRAIKDAPSNKKSLSLELIERQLRVGAGTQAALTAKQAEIVPLDLQVWRGSIDQHMRDLKHQDGLARFLFETHDATTASQCASYLSAIARSQLYVGQMDAARDTVRMIEAMLPGLRQGGTEGNEPERKVLSSLCVLQALVGDAEAAMANAEKSANVRIFEQVAGALYKAGKMEAAAEAIDRHLKQVGEGDTAERRLSERASIVRQLGKEVDSATMLALFEPLYEPIRQELKDPAKAPYAAYAAFQGALHICSTSDAKSARRWMTLAEESLPAVDDIREQARRRQILLLLRFKFGDIDVIREYWDTLPSGKQRYMLLFEVGRNGGSLIDRPESLALSAEALRYPSLASALAEWSVNDPSMKEEFMLENLPRIRKATRSATLSLAQLSNLPTFHFADRAGAEKVIATFEPPHHRAMAFLQLAVAYQKDKNEAEARRNLLAAYNAVMSPIDDAGNWSLLQHIGGELIKIGENERVQAIRKAAAKACIAERSDMYKGYGITRQVLILGDVEGVSAILDSITRPDSRRQKLRETLIALKEAYTNSGDATYLQSIVALGDRQACADLLAAAAKMHLDAGRAAEAAPILERAHQLAMKELVGDADAPTKHTSFSWRETDLLSGLALLHMQRKQVDRAIECLALIPSTDARCEHQINTARAGIETGLTKELAPLLRAAGASAAKLKDEKGGQDKNPYGKAVMIAELMHKAGMEDEAESALSSIIDTLDQIKPTSFLNPRVQAATSLLDLGQQDRAMTCLRRWHAARLISAQSVGQVLAGIARTDAARANALITDFAASLPNDAERVGLYAGAAIDLSLQIDRDIAKAKKEATEKSSAQP